MSRRPVVAAGALLALLAAGSAGASSSAPAASASARAFAIKVVVPGQAGAATGSVAAPGNQVSFGASFAYPADGSAVTSGSLTGSATTSTSDGTAAANAGAEVVGLSLFGGEITAAQVVAKAQATAREGEGSGEVGGSGVTGLVVLGQAIAAAPGKQVALGDWGQATVLAQSAAPAEKGYRATVTALEVRLTADHGGLPAGSVIQVGYAEASASAPPAPPPPAPPPKPRPTTTQQAPAATEPATTTTREQAPRAAPREPRRASRPLVRRPPPGIEVQLAPGGYVFPVHGPSSFSNTFGAPRAGVGWHHGEDIFAPMGAPVLAVTKGTVFSVGWNDYGGNRLWLRDTVGNEFYYAHLSAFSPLAVDGTEVEAGDVLGFVGNSGDAEGTPPHLHFEIHPVGMLSLGYDGVVDPNEYLLAWQRLDEIRLVAGATWTPPLAPKSTAPQPGAFLLSSSDISTASGGPPGSLQRALAAAPPAGGPAGQAVGAAERLEPASEEPAGSP